MVVSIIAAVARNGVIGRNGGLPWRLKDDMALFKRTTAGRTVISGRKSYESIPERFRPLPGRANIVVTCSPAYDARGASVVGSLDEAIALARANGEVEAFIIGGGQVYREAMDRNLAQRMYLTRVEADPEGDVRFPPFSASDWRELVSWRAGVGNGLTEGAVDSYPFTFSLLERVRT